MQREGIAGSTGRARQDQSSPWWHRLVTPAAIFAVAFAVDMLTGQRLSSVWGSIAIAASVFTVFPSIRRGIAAIGAYGGVWAVFNAARAVVDDAEFAIGGQRAIVNLERWLFGGRLPSTSLQARFFDHERTAPHDVLLSLVHGSFFVVPFVVTAIVWRQRRDLFAPVTVATALTFAMGIVGFALLPTSPPWHAAPDEVSRVTHAVLAQATGGNSNGSPALAFEPNHLAAMPSVHVAATVLVSLTARRFGRVPAIAGLVYAVLMSAAVLYLGEHYVVDALGGWAIALAGWSMAMRQSSPATGQARVTMEPTTGRKT